MTDSQPIEHSPRLCPKCEEETLFKRHCKIVCEQCGVIYDCSDPFR